MLAAANVSDWIVTPAPLNAKRSGWNAKISADNSTVQRLNLQNPAGCLCYTRGPLPPGQVWQITVLQSIRKWNYGLRVGLTTTVPSVMPYMLLDSNSGPHEWNYKWTTLWHKGRGISTGLPDLDFLETHKTVGLLLTSDGELHLYHDGIHTKMVATDLPVCQDLWGAVDVRGSCTIIKSELLSEPTFFAVMDRSLKAALLDGFIPHRDDKFLIHGPGGVGKSSLIAMFLGKQRHLLRISTPVAMQPLHLSPRKVSTTTYTTDWEEVDYRRLSLMVAHTAKEMYRRWLSDNVGRAKDPLYSEVMATVPDNSPQQVAYLASTKHLDTSAKAQFSKVVGRLRSGIKTLFKKTLTTSLSHDPHNIEGFFTEFQHGLRDLVVQCGVSSVQDVLVSHSIRIVDSGGQPQFHDLLSIFIPELSGLVSVFKLSEALAVRGEVAFYEEGELTCAPYESHYTNEQVIRHDLQVLQSEATCCGVEHMPNLAFVGTHFDTYSPESCSESPDEKDGKLKSIITEILPEEMQPSVISTGGSLNHITFRINAREPAEADFEKVDQLKHLLLSKSRAKSRDLPLKWYGYEVALHLLMQELGRQCLSRRECEFIGHKLGFDLPSLNAALDYLRQLNILSFFDVLPGVVFGSSQVILDKITELVTCNLELKNASRAMTGTQRKFLQQGIVSLDILQSPKLSKHYIDGLFEPKHLLDVLESKLVVTRIDQNNFAMPSVLEVGDIYPSPPVPEGNVRSSFVLHFSKKSPMLGIYCCTISYLLTKAGWKLLKGNDEVVQVARNSTTFEIPGNVPGRLTFLDPLSSYLQIVVELPKIVACKRSDAILCEIRDTFFVAVQQAMQTLNYEVKIPELAFLCPEQSSRCSIFPHLATVDESHEFLTCSKNPGHVFRYLSPDQKMLLPTICEEEKDGFMVVFTASSVTAGQNEEVHVPAKTMSPPPTSAGTTVEKKVIKNVVPVGTQRKIMQEASVEDSEEHQTHKAVVAPPLSISGEKPDLLQLLEIDFPSRVGPKINVLGSFLLQDNLGNKMAIISENCRGRPKDMVMEVLREWLAGKGVEVSWDSLIATLKKSKLLLMAKQIQMALDQLSRE